MKKIIRALLFVFAIAVGALLGAYLLIGFELSKMCFFLGACILLGCVLHVVDKKFTDN